MSHPILPICQRRFLSAEVIASAALSALSTHPSKRLPSGEKASPARTRGGKRLGGKLCLLQCESIG